jgi:D-alanyl-lipoteichoic acid acyltransferase DltB (MBOAT superfamily)
MLFPTVEYALFFLVVFALAWESRRPLWQHKTLLLAASYFFYGFWDWRFLPLLVGISLLAACVSRWVQAASSERARKSWLTLGVVLALGTLGFFKYRGFAAQVLVQALSHLGVGWSPKLPELALPVGVSFFVFHAISLMVDAYRGALKERVRILDALLYVAFFPQLVAGPILRASSFMPQLRVPRDPGDIDAAKALELIVLGLAKKVLIANYLATHLVDAVFEAPQGHAASEVLVAIYGYAAQIYCDFSGYTDIAIGSALLLGYTFPENFRAPYLAASPQEFWHRWHISLSSWLRDYLYVPLGGSRRGPAFTLLNLMITMVLGGLWHGAAWNFVVWGTLHGLLLVVHRLWSAWKPGPLQVLRRSFVYRALSTLLTFHAVCLGWVFFRASSSSVALAVLSTLRHAAWTNGPWLAPTVVLALLLGIAGQAWPEHWDEGVRVRFARLPLVLQGVALSLAIAVIEVCGPTGIPPFIYFQF